MNTEVFLAFHSLCNRKAPPYLKHVFSMLKMLTLLETVTVYTSSIDMLLTLRARVFCLHEEPEFLDASL